MSRPPWLDATEVGSELTSAQQDETIADLIFFLDVYGSTRAVRATLQVQERDIQRLRERVQRQLDAIGKRSPHEETKTDENTQKSVAIGDEKNEGTDAIMIDVDFFLKTFGSTRAVRDKLCSQKQEIEHLQHFIQWYEDREKTNTGKSLGDVKDLSAELVQDSMQKQQEPVEYQGIDRLPTTGNNRDPNGTRRWENYTESDAHEVNVEEKAGDGIIIHESKHRTTKSLGNADGEDHRVVKAAIVQTTAVEIVAGGGAQSNGCAVSVGEGPAAPGYKTAPTLGKAGAKNKMSNKGEDNNPRSKTESLSTLSKNSSDHADHTSSPDVDQTKATHTLPKIFCRYLGCIKLAQARNLCYYHGGYHTCKISGCGKYAVFDGQGHCFKHALEFGIMMKPGKKTCQNCDCERFPVARGGGYCRKHAQEHGILGTSGKKKCWVGGCKTFTRSKGYCAKHAVKVSKKKCRIAVCERFVASRGEGYCCIHAREHGPISRVAKSEIVKHSRSHAHNEEEAGDGVTMTLSQHESEHQTTKSHDTAVVKSTIVPTAALEIVAGGGVQSIGCTVSVGDELVKDSTTAPDCKTTPTLGKEGAKYEKSNEGEDNDTRSKIESLCRIGGCDAIVASRDEGLCTRQDHDNGYAMKSSRNKCDFDDCEKFKVAGGAGYCYRHAREHGIVLQSDTRKCLFEDCDKFSVSGGEGYCCRHAREHGIHVTGGKKCCISNCDKFAKGQGFCIKHARSRGIIICGDKKCSIDGCETFAVSNGHGYCTRHAREHNIVVKNGKRCRMDDCEKFAVARGEGYCCKHAREHNITVKGGKKCCVDDCKSLMISSGEGYCGRHARHHGVVFKRKCKSMGCLKFRVDESYCQDHLPESARIGNNEEPLTCQNRSDYQGDSVPCNSPRSSKLTPSSCRIIKRRGPHVVCKTSGCKKWVMRNGDINEYCAKHRGDLSTRGFCTDSTEKLQRGKRY